MRACPNNITELLSHGGEGEGERERGEEGGGEGRRKVFRQERRRETGEHETIRRQQLGEWKKKKRRGNMTGKR